MLPYVYNALSIISFGEILVGFSGNGMTKKNDKWKKNKSKNSAHVFSLTMKSSETLLRL